MEVDVKREAIKQYLRYFRVWFIAVGVLALITIVLAGVRSTPDDAARGNNSAPAERVYDYADLLTDEEEQKLRERIADLENRIHMDIVIVTLNQSMEGNEAMQENRAVSPNLEDVMEAFADNFWDDNGYGYNKPFEGDGILLADNVYEGQGYWELSTSGRAETLLSTYDIDSLLDTLAARYDRSVYSAYCALVDAFADSVDLGGGFTFPWIFVIVIPTAVALIYAFVNLKKAPAKDTTISTTYVAGGRPTFNVKRDDFVRKFVTTRHIERSSSGGGGHSSGGGGHHYSSSGASHGGGGRRH